MGKIDDFLSERKFLVGVSERTLGWHSDNLKWLPNENPTEAECKRVVVKMREKGWKPITVNGALRSINAYLRWSGASFTIPKLKEEQTPLPTFAQEDIKRMMVYKPTDAFEQRIQCLLLMLADTGCRITELLQLKWQDLDFNNLLVTIRGKGGKSRVIPFSVEMRKRLLKMKKDSHLVFATRNETQMLRCNVLRYAKRWCRELGIVPPRRTLHAFRHSTAVHFIRSGDSQFHLMKMLGHSTLEMTNRYVALNTQDLQQVHRQVSLLA